MENYRIIRPQASGAFEEALESVIRQLTGFLEDESGDGRKPVYMRFFLSDAQNQAAALKERLSGCGEGVRTGDSRTGLPLRDSIRGPRKIAFFGVDKRATLPVAEGMPAGLRMIPGSARELWACRI